MIGTLVVVLIALALLYYVAAPLRRPTGPAPSIRPHSDPGADAAKRSALEALVEIEEERAMGKLTDPDFAAIRARYEAVAVEAIERVDRAGAGTEDGALEEEIAAVRSQLQCPACGAMRGDSEHCPRCGA